MSERFMLYSCIIHEELQHGKTIKEIARLMGLTIKNAQELANKYTANFEEYHSYDLEELLKRRAKVAVILDEVRRKIKYPIAEKAFHMAITKDECRQRLAIQQRVERDEYLSKGYRRTGEKEKIISNYKKYQW